MTTYREVYCVAADLRTILPDIANYDEKRTLTGWAVSSGSLYVLGSVGSITVLYRDNLELTEVQALNQCTSDGKWYMDDAADAVYLYSTADPTTTHTIHAGDDWATLQTNAMESASEDVRSIVNKPIYYKKGVGYQDESERDWDQVIIDSAAGLACARLIRHRAPELANEIEWRYNRESDLISERGKLQFVRDGLIKLHHETNKARKEGEIVEVALGASTTGSISDTRGEATHTDIVKIVIGTGGTFAYGTASPVTYSVYIGDDTGRQTNQIINAEIVNGDYQTFAHGLEGRFEPGVYVAADEWWIFTSGEKVETLQSIYTRQLTRKD